jgi:hypothetical protein
LALEACYSGLEACRLAFHKLGAWSLLSKYWSLRLSNWSLRLGVWIMTHAPAGAVFKEVHLKLDA